MYICFFSGPPDGSPEFRDRLERLVEHLVSACDVTSFIVGERGAFDDMAAAAVRRAKARYGNLFLYRLAPNFRAVSGKKPPEGFDGFFYGNSPWFLPRALALEAAEKKALQSVHYFVYCSGRKGDAASRLANKAETRQSEGKLTVFDLAEC